MATQTAWKSGLTCYALRLKPGEELYSSLLTFKKENNLQAAFVMTCCGSVTKATLRLARRGFSEPNNVRNTELFRMHWFCVVPGFHFDTWYHYYSSYVLQQAVRVATQYASAPLQVDNIFAFIRQVAPVPACWLLRHQQQVDLWPWKWCPSQVWRGLPPWQF